MSLVLFVVECIANFAMMRLTSMWSNMSLGSASSLEQAKTAKLPAMVVPVSAETVRAQLARGGSKCAVIC